MPPLLPTPFEQARRAELERLTGCPIHHVIEGTCHEAGCQNAALQLQKEFILSEEMCLRVHEIAHAEGIQPPDATNLIQKILPAYTRDIAPIFQTQPRLRCVL
ncbi:MAG: hypothetical protein H6636_00880 [Anaerolineales bacterium]|nr:hypothetical protein [Anaerolineales bacterium]